MAVDASPTFFSVTLTSSVSSFGAEKRFPASVTIADLKGKLELITGATSTLMQLQLFNSDGKLVCELDNNTATLGSYPVENGFRIHAIDNDPSKKLGDFEDTSQVEKYEISEEAYSKRSDSVLAFKKRMKMGQFADKDPAAEAQAKEQEEEERQEAEAISVGSRCEVTMPGAVPRRATVMFVGKTDFSKSGYWVGVKYDEPFGKNDGSVKGRRYFECPPKYGAFVRPRSVKVGDYPEESYSDDEM